MKEKNITSISLEDLVHQNVEGRNDWERLRRERTSGIEPEIDPDKGEFDWSQEQITIPQPKKAISLRVDRDIIEFFKSEGKGYQTRMNAVLRSYMKARQS